MEYLRHFSVLEETIGTYRNAVRHTTRSAVFLKQNLLFVSYLNMAIYA